VYEQVAQRLRQEAARRPELAGTIDLYCALLDVQDRVEIEPGGALDAQEAAARLDQGLPLLPPETVAADGLILAELCDHIVSIMAERQPEHAKALAAARAWLSEERERLGSHAVECLRGGDIGEGDQADLLALILDAALRPLLRARASSLATLVNDAAWYRGYCPVCGGEPDFAALDRQGGRRRLLCSRCDSTWTFLRVGCPFCGNSDPQQLGHYPSEDGAYRLNVCESCRRYIKTIDLRETAGERMLEAERVLTVAMDLAAEEAGYQQG
jgi:FdhE protein